MAITHLKGAYYDSDIQSIWTLNDVGTYEELSLGGGVTIYTGDGSLEGNRIVDLNGHDLSFSQTVSGKTNELALAGNGNNISMSVTVADGFSRVTASFIDIDLVSRDTTNHHGGELIIDAFEALTGATYTDYDTVPTGIKYDADYSATFVDRSLVDKAYVDAAIAAALP